MLNSGHTLIHSLTLHTIAQDLRLAPPLSRPMCMRAKGAGLEEAGGAISRSPPLSIVLSDACSCVDIGPKFVSPVVLMGSESQVLREVLIGSEFISRARSESSCPTVRWSESTRAILATECSRPAML